MNIRELLRRNPALAAGDDAVLAQVAKESEVRIYDRGTKVALVGGQQTHVLLIASGRLELYRKNKEDDTQMLVGVLDPPAIFGDAELYGRSPWIVSARASRDSIVVRIPNGTFDRMIDQDPKIAASLYRDVCARHLLVVEVMQVFGLQKTKNKILRLLQELAKPIDDGASRRLARVTQVQLAQALGMVPRTIRRHLQELEREGLISRCDDGIFIEAAGTPWAALRGGFGAAWKLPEKD
jgi:CRP-like cAMP-binding protein